MEAKKSIGQAVPTAQLGGGYSDDREMPTTNRCVHIPSVYYDGNSVAYVNFSSSVTYEVLTQELSNSVAAGINLGIFSTDVTTNYLQYFLSIFNMSKIITL